MQSPIYAAVVENYWNNQRFVQITDNKDALDCEVFPGIQVSTTYHDLWSLLAEIHRIIYPYYSIETDVYPMPCYGPATVHDTMIAVYICKQLSKYLGKVCWI